MVNVCLSIAGWDGSGGAGIQADLKTFAALGCYGTSVLTALPVQNTQGVSICHDFPPSWIQNQLESVFFDIRPQAIKIGMLSTSSIIACVADFIKAHGMGIPVVLDPVMMAQSGEGQLLKPDALAPLISDLFPLSTLITPNLMEAYALVGSNTLSKYEMADALLAMGCEGVYLKGGHDQGDEAMDLLYDRTQSSVFSAKRIQTVHTHGSGCTLSSAITAFLARGHGVKEACDRAKQYVHGAIQAGQHGLVGQGSGPLHHFFDMWDERI